MIMKENSAKLVYVGKISCRNKLTRFLKKMGKSRGSWFLQVIVPIITNFAEFNSTINRNRNVQQFNLASLINGYQRI